MKCEGEISWKLTNWDNRENIINQKPVLAEYEGLAQWAMTSQNL